MGVPFGWKLLPSNEREILTKCKMDASLPTEFTGWLEWALAKQFRFVSGTFSDTCSRKAHVSSF
jgi:hypothetical protein